MCKTTVVHVGSHSGKLCFSVLGMYVHWGYLRFRLELHELIQNCNKIQNQELHSFSFACNIVTVIKANCMRLARHIGYNSEKYPCTWKGINAFWRYELNWNYSEQCPSVGFRNNERNLSSTIAGNVSNRGTNVFCTGNGRWECVCQSSGAAIN